MQSRLNPNLASPNQSSGSSSTTQNISGPSNASQQSNVSANTQSGTTTPTLGLAQNPRATDRVPVLNYEAFKTCSPQGIGTQLERDLSVWNSEFKKDGSREGILGMINLCVQSMVAAGCNEKQINGNIIQLFFSDMTPGMDDVGRVMVSGQNVSIDFFGNILPLVCPAPIAYQANGGRGLDDNMREFKSDQMAGGGFTNDQGYFLGVRETFMSNWQLMDQFFLQDPNNSMWLGQPRNGAFRDAWMDWLHAVMVPGYMAAGVLAASTFAQGLPLSTMTPQQVLNAIIQFLLNWGGTPGARAHTTIEIQDEAIAKVVMQGLGFTVNIDSDNWGMSQIAQNNLPSQIGAGAAQNSASSPNGNQSGTAANQTPSIESATDDLSSHTKIMAAIETVYARNEKLAEMDGEQRSRQSDVKHGLYIGPDGNEMGFYGRLPEEGKAQYDGFGFDKLTPLVEAGYRLKHATERDPFDALLDAWYAVESAIVTGEDSKGLSASLEAAVTAFKAACNDGMGK